MRKGEKEIKVLFAIAEAEPFAKTGGLGDVGGSLPQVINRLQGEARVMMPKYASIPASLKESLVYLTCFTVPLGWRRQYCGLWETEYQGVHYYFIDNEYYFKRDMVYGYRDDGERFAYFSRAVLECLIHLKVFRPDLIHCHDWHTALIPVMLKEYYGGDPFYDGIKTLLTIHNLKFQGVFPKKVLGDWLGLEENSPGAESLVYRSGVNFLKGGLLSVDGITTVSPSYGAEILTPEFGEGLEGFLQKRKDQITGILNGIDREKYHPGKDPVLFAHYPSPTWKKENKEKLQALLNLPVKEDVLFIAIVSRLTDQKGLDLLPPIMEEILEMEIQLVVLGTGEKKYEEMFLSFAQKYPEKLAVKIMFHEELARKIYAGADLFLMPSRFEPCGLAQMMAMCYGTIPLVRETGGLKDTVIPFNQEAGSGNGFAFTSYSFPALLSILKEAVRIFREDWRAWQGLMDRAMEADFSWEKSARKYLDLYQEIMRED
jgi:starch synthase